MRDATSNRDDCLDAAEASPPEVVVAKEKADPPIEEPPISEPAPSQVRLRDTRERRRSRRKRAVRAHTICVKRLSRLEIELGKTLYPDVPVERPKTRADCEHGERPCPFVSCAHHLYLDVLSKTGAIKLNFPDLEVWEMTETCSLDVADRGAGTLEDVGAIVNLTRERIRQVEVTALAKLAALEEREGLKGYADEGASGKRRLPILGQRAERPADLDDDELTGLASDESDPDEGSPDDWEDFEIDAEDAGAAGELAHELGGGRGRLKAG